MGNILRRALAATVLTASAVGGVLATSVPAAHAAAVINVPGSQPTIQAGIDAASNGDTVEVAPGTYSEHIDFKGKAITVESSEGPDSTTIDGGGTGTVVTFSHNETRATTLRGFTITHASNSGIRASSSSPTIVDNRIVNNNFCGEGGGVYSNFASPRIENNFIAGNTQAGCSGGIGGGGIAVGGSSHAEIIGNQILGNAATQSSGGGITLFASGATVVENNQIVGNRAYNNGAGMWIVNDSPATIAQNLIFDNAGIGVYWLVPLNSVGPQFVNNTVARNNGPALFADGFDHDAQVVNNVLSTVADHAVVCGTFNDTNPPMFSHNIADTSLMPSYTWSGCDPTGTNGNLTADPQFVDPDNHNPGDFHLKAGSPAIDAGDNAAPSLSSFDLDAYPRISDGDSNGSAIVDMGAYELPPVGFTATAVTSTVNPSVPGEAVSLTATVTAASGGTPSGSVQFRDGGSDLGGPIDLAPASTNSAKAGLTTSSLAIGSHTITAIFTPDSSPFLGSTSQPYTQVVQPRPTTTVVTSASNPSIAGGSVSLTATVTAGSGSDFPTGTVQFKDGSTNLGGVQALSPTGTPGRSSATLSTILPVGSHTITAEYTSSSTDFAASTSGPVTQLVDYAVTFTYNTTQIYKVGTNVHIKVQLRDGSGTNVSAATLAVTAQCVVAAGGSCGDAGAVPITAPFVFHQQDKGASFYDYEVHTKGMTPGTYDVVFTAAGDPVQHRAPLLLKK